jgi:hypothetical protein
MMCLISLKAVHKRNAQWEDVILMLALSNYLTDYVEIWNLLEDKYRKVWSLLHLSCDDIILVAGKI